MGMPVKTVFLSGYRDMNMPKYDEIGYWSEVKLEIIQKYASAYSTILSKQRSIQKYLYSDAFSGSGIHIKKQTRDYVFGSPLNALAISPEFSEYHFIDLDGDKVDKLRQIVGDRKGVSFHKGDCNKVLLEEVFPRCRYEDYHRALCLIDPYGLNVNWGVLQKAGEMGSIEIFYNFMIMDANMNVLWRILKRSIPTRLPGWTLCGETTRGKRWPIKELQGCSEKWRKKLLIKK